MYVHYLSCHPNHRVVDPGNSEVGGGPQAVRCDRAVIGPYLPMMM